jgi:hypothetical protein
VLNELAPDYIVAEDTFINTYQSSNAKTVATWQEFSRYIDRYCPTLVTRAEYPDYGIVYVYRCN